MLIFFFFHATTTGFEGFERHQDRVSLAYGPVSGRTCSYERYTSR